MEQFSVDRPALATPKDAKVTPPTTAASAPTTAHAAVVLGAFALVAIAWWVATVLIHDPTFDATAAPKPVAGLTIFAVFFVAAQGIERLLEPLTQLLPAPKDDEGQTAKAAHVAVQKADKSYALLVDSPSPAERENHDENCAAAHAAVGAAAKAKAAPKVRKSDLSVASWAVASVVGVLASAGLKLYFLRTVGIAAPPRALEVLATGLIIGAGTKPLHDLVKLIEAKKENAQAGT